MKSILSMGSGNGRSRYFKFKRKNITAVKQRQFQPREYDIKIFLYIKWYVIIDDNRYVNGIE